MFDGYSRLQVALLAAAAALFVAAGWVALVVFLA